MSIMLFAFSAVAIVAGIVMVGFSIPINDFSLGHTLIVAGTTAIVGSLILFALAVAVGKLQRIAEALAVKSPPRGNRQIDQRADSYEPQINPLPAAVQAALAPLAPVQQRPQIPTRSGNAGYGQEPHPLDPRFAPAPPPASAPDERYFQNFGPALRNPDEPPFAVAESEAVPLSPQPYPFPAAPRIATPPKVSTESKFASEFGDSYRPAPAVTAPAVNGSGAGKNYPEPALDTGRRAPAAGRPPQTAYFDAMWPAEPRAEHAPGGSEPLPSAKPAAPLSPQAVPFGRAGAPAAEPKVPRKPSEARAVAILKSGIVDGMGYTLYVDGSIEAELPQGILRFASIADLRTHLEKN